METPLLSRKSLATRWKVKMKTLDQWRWSGRGPQYVKIGRKVFYRVPAIEHFEECKEQKSTSSPSSTNNLSFCLSASLKKGTKSLSRSKGAHS
jgi:hypothetical protein